MWMEMGWGCPKAMGKLSGMRKLYGWGRYKPVLGALKSLGTTPGTSWQPEGAGMGIGPTAPSGHPQHCPGHREGP